MNISRRIILVALILCIGLSALLGIYISGQNKNKKGEKGITLESQKTEVYSKNTVATNNYINPRLNSIGTATKIVKKQIYTIGDPYEVVKEEKSNEEIIGMDKDLFDEYAKSKGYIVEEFNGEKIVIVEKINKWPSGLYVIKSIDENIALYKVNEDGELSKIRVTNVVLDQVSDIEKPSLIKGKVYKSLESAEETIAEYDS